MADWVKNIIVCAGCIFFMGGMLHIASAAESSSDAPVDKQRKEDLRKKILGSTEAGNVDEEYRIGYNDILYVEIYGEGPMFVGYGGSAPSRGASTNNSDNVRGRGTGAEVQNDGRIALKHIGDVYVVGMTLTQLADYLKELYSSIYENPSITASLMQSNSRQYTVMGNIKAPGVYHLDYPLTIVKAVAKAGGFSEWSNSDVTVIRESVISEEKSEDNKQQQNNKTFKFDYDKFIKGKNVEKNITILPGDVIVVH